LARTRPAQHLYLVPREFAPRSHRQAAKRERANPHPTQPLDRRTQHPQNLADLAIAGLADGNFDQRPSGLAPEDDDVLNGLPLGLATRKDALTGMRAGVGLVRQPEFRPYRGHQPIIDLAFDRRVIGLHDSETRMSQSMGQFAVVRQQDQAGRVIIEPPDRKKSSLGGVIHKVEHGAALRARLIGQGHEGPLRLVQHHVQMSLGL